MVNTNGGFKIYEEIEDDDSSTSLHSQKRKNMYTSDASQPAEGREVVTDSFLQCLV